ncbi:MAG: molybdate ABC transporter substrate-binding protein [Candidatus Obscuribacterales bacterium]|jgi:molybdate transport system substrate-binding protein|nr:molybdate ABC transporter substrate-binding protein [Candidatus Obscuribacterales bacterium]
MGTKITETLRFCREITVVLCVSLFFLSSCLTSPSTTKQPQLIVSAAISLKEALSEIATDFEKSENCKVTYNYASTGELAAQLRNGAPVDVFVSASMRLIDQLTSNNIIKRKSVSKIAGNKLVLISSKKQLNSIEDLRNAQNVSIGNPQTVPAGTHAEQALKQYGLYEELLQKRKLVFAENARQVLTYVEQGDVEAGIVYNTDANLCSRCKIGFSIPESASGQVVYEAGIVSASKSEILAQRFLDRLRSPAARKIFKAKGFVLNE